MKLWRFEVDELLLDSALTFGLRLGGAAAVYISYVMLARLLDIDSFGDLVFAQSALWLLAAVATLGVASSVLRFVPEAVGAERVDRLKGVVRWSYRAPLVASACVVVLGGLAVWLYDPDLSSLRAQILLVAVVSVPIVTLQHVQANLGRALMWYVFAAVTSTFLRPVVLLAYLAVLAWFARDWVEARSLLVAQLVIVAGIVLCQAMLLRRRLRDRFAGVTPVDESRQWMPVSLLLLLSSLYLAFYIDVHVFVSGLFLSSADLAAFNAVLRTLAIVSFASVAVGVALAPRAARAHATGDREGLARLVSRALHLTLWPSLAALLVLVAAGRFVLGLFGEAFVEAYPVLVVAAVAQAFAAATTPLASVLSMVGAERPLLMITALGLGVAVLAHALLVPTFGVMGAGYALLVSAVAWLALLYACVRRTLLIDAFTARRLQPATARA